VRIKLQLLDLDSPQVQPRDLARLVKLVRMLERFFKRLLVVLRELSKLLGENYGVELLLHVVCELPHRRLKLGSRQIGVRVCRVDSLAAFSAELERLRHRIGDLLLREKRT